MKLNRILAGICALVCCYSSPMCFAAPAVTAPLEQVAASVVQVISLDGEREVAHGTGFFVTEDGKIATSFQTVQDAVSKSLNLKVCMKEVGDNLIDADVWSVYPDRDLAILYLKGDKKLKTKPLKFIDAEAKPGQPAWAIGYPVSSGLKASAAPVNIKQVVNVTEVEKVQRAEYEKLNKSYRAVSNKAQIEVAVGPLGNMARNSAWIQADGALDPGNSGGPVVDGTGAVVGIATSMIINTRPNSFIIEISSVKQFLTKLAAKPVGIDSVAVVPELRVRKNSDTAAGNDKSERSVGMPPVEIKPFDALSKTKPLQLSESADIFHDAVRKTCTACKGTGEIVSTRQMTTINKEWKEKTKAPCKVCNDGFMRAKPEVIQRTALNLIKTLSTVAPETPENADFRTQALDKTAAAFVYDGMNGDLIQSTCIRNLQKDKLAPDSYVAAKGIVLGATLYGNTRRFVVWIPDTDLIFLVDRPVDHDRPIDYAEVAFGGAVTTTIDTRSGRVLIVQGGFIRTYSKLRKLL